MYGVSPRRLPDVRPTAHTMGMPAAAHRYTATEVLGFPYDGNRYELVHGELLVTPAPSQAHQIVLGRLHVWLQDYARVSRRSVQVFFSPADIMWSEAEYVQPDLFVVPAEEVTGNWRDCRTLLLAVEVASPGSARADRVTKRRLYQERGVATYWMVDPSAELVEVWHPQDERPEIVSDTLRWRVSPDSPEVAITLADVFAELPQ